MLCVIGEFQISSKLQEPIPFLCYAIRGILLKYLSLGRQVVKITEAVFFDLVVWLAIWASVCDALVEISSRLLAFFGTPLMRLCKTRGLGEVFLRLLSNEDLLKEKSVLQFLLDFPVFCYCPIYYTITLLIF